MIGEHLLRFNKDLKIVFCDFETEGLNLVRSRPWQAAMIIFHGDRLVEELDLYPWWPDLNVSPEAAAVTRFKWDEYKAKATDSKKCREQYLRYRNDPQYRLVFHNGLGYDIMIDSVWGREVGEDIDYSWIERVIDTNSLAKGMKKGIPVNSSSLSDFLAWQIKIATIVEKGLKTNLTAMGKEFKISYDYAMLHDGLNDIRLNKLVFDKMKWIVEV